ncbi:unnamed protein product [Prunus armeniaca]
MSESNQEQSSPEPLSPRTAAVRAGLRRNYSSSSADSKSSKSEGSSRMAKIPNNNNNVERGGALVVQPRKPLREFSIPKVTDQPSCISILNSQLTSLSLQVKFFPAQKTNKIRKEILGFTQKEGEAFHECWERYKEMISSCPHHNIESWMQMQSFYECLLDSERMMVDATSGEGLMNKTADEAFTLFESLSANSQQWSHNKGR